MRLLKHFVILLLLASTGCTEVMGKMAFLGDLQQEIIEKYDTEEIDLHFKNNVLEVTFKDSKFQGYTESQKQKIAYQIGRMANSMQEDGSKIEAGVVNFVDEDNLILVKSSSADSYQMFE